MVDHEKLNVYRSSLRMGPLLLGLALLLASGGCRSSAPASRVLVIGLDGATWDLLDPWIEAGDLPNLEALAAAGAAGTLESVYPPMSPPAWTSAITGKNPAKHGIFDFWIRPPNRAEVVPATSLDRRAEAVWQILSRNGRKVGLINIPLTDPPDAVNGFMIAGFPHLDEEGYTYPPDLESRLGDYQLDYFGEMLVEGHEEELHGRLTTAFEERARVALTLMEEEDWDLFWVVFTGPDKMQHFFWRFQDPAHPYYREAQAETYREAIHNFWKRVDEVVGEITARAGDDTVVMVLSDHGFSPIYREIRLRNWLMEDGYLDAETGRALAYYQGDLGGRIYINLRGREPKGQVQSGRPYRILREEIAARLMDLVDPETGVRPVTEVHFAEEVFSGPYLREAPDIVFLVKPGYFVVSGRGEPGEAVFGLPSYSFSAYHRREGILMMAGPPIQRGITLTPQRIEGIAPTILYLLGQALPADMDGTVFAEALNSDCLVRHQIRFAEPVALVREEVPPEVLQKRREALGSVPYLR